MFDTIIQCLSSALIGKARRSRAAQRHEQLNQHYGVAGEADWLTGLVNGILKYRAPVC